MGALGGRRLLDSTAEPGGKGGGSSQTLALMSPVFPASCFPCWLPALVFLHLAKVTAILALSELGLAHLAEETTGGRSRRK